MIYLDYSATTPVDKDILKAFVNCNETLYGNPNSTHRYGLLSDDLVLETTNKIQRLLDASNFEVIYTSGATEANNLAIKGYAQKNSHKGKHIISSPYEHSSVTSCLNYLEKNGFEVDILAYQSDGLIDLDELRSLIRDDTILVSIAMINSELGIKQNIGQIHALLQQYPQVVFHSDMTQAIGKTAVSVNHCDLVTFSGHKIYGLKGIGALLRKKHISLEPVIHGGKSTSIYRGGTPAVPLIESLGLALDKTYQDVDQKIEHITSLNRYLKEQLTRFFADAHINYDQGIPQILNVSFKNFDAHSLQKALSDRDIYISTQTACSSESSYSVAVYQLTKSDLLAKTSVRISLSHLTTFAEVEQLIEALKEIHHENR